MLVLGILANPLIESPDDENNLTYHGNFDNLKSGKAAQVKAVPVERNEYKPVEDTPKKPKEARPDTSISAKVHPHLKKQIGDAHRNSRAHKLVEVVVVFKPDNDTLIPRFPTLDENEPRDSPANKKRLADADAIIGDLKTKRQKKFGRRYKNLLEKSGTENASAPFWLLDAATAHIPYSQITALSEAEEVAYVEPRIMEDVKPPADANDKNDPIVARTTISSDPYYVTPASGMYIGLLDTGVRSTHTMFTNPSYLGLRYDCTTNPCTINAGNDPCWNHGTSTSGIISGNANIGARWRGVTQITLDVLNIYSCAGLDTAATVRAVQRAIAILDKVIVAEIQAVETLSGAIVTAHEQAYDAGVAVIAANGNFGPNAGTVRSPALGRKVLGVGAVDVESGTLMSYSGRGPTSDGRIKPDVTMPTNTESASNANDAALQVFTGTSGATPYGGAAAAAYTNWLRRAGFTPEPGHIYAALIASGSKPAFDNNEGAGRVQMFTGGAYSFGRTTVATGGVVNVAVSVPAGSTRPINAALWWPETAAGHNDVDLWLLSESGGLLTFSVSSASVFEKVRYAPVASGVARTFQVSIRGYNVPHGPQTVYYYINH